MNSGLLYTTFNANAINDPNFDKTRFYKQIFKQTATISVIDWVDGSRWTDMHTGSLYLTTYIPRRHIQQRYLEFEVTPVYEQATESLRRIKATASGSVALEGKRIQSAIQSDDMIQYLQMIPLVAPPQAPYPVPPVINNVPVCPRVPFNVRACAPALSTSQINMLSQLQHSQLSTMIGRVNNSEQLSLQSRERQNDDNLEEEKVAEYNEFAYTSDTNTTEIPGHEQLQGSLGECDLDSFFNRRPEVKKENIEEKEDEVEGGDVSSKLKKVVRRNR